MARSRLCRACGDFHTLEGAWPVDCYGHFGVIANAAPNIRPDAMPAMRSMADGRMYDGKSAYYASVRNAGCEIVGDDRASFDKPGPRFDPGPVAPDIKRAIEELRSR